MAHAANLYRVVARVDEKQPIITGTKALFLKILQGLHIAGAGFGESVQSVENPHRGGSVESTYVGLGLVRPNDPLQSGSW